MLKNKADFIFIGYSIRKRSVRSFRIHKPGTIIITADSAMSAPHPLLSEPGWEKIGEYLNGLRDIRYSIDLIKNLYSGLSQKEKKEYAIFGYEIERSRITEYRHMQYDPRTGIHSTPLKFEYALVNPVESVGEFRGFDIIDGNVEWTSALIDCDINWRLAEECGVLNRHNLFNDYAAAICFREKADELIQEHAPFAVWGIYEVSVNE